MDDDERLERAERALEAQLDRLAPLLLGEGREPFLRGPIVLPDGKWFPDRWTPDLESVRKLSLRLLAYAGLPEFEVECGVFQDRHENWLPPLLQAGAPTSHRGAAAVFLGIEEGCVYFGVDVQQLQRPDVLAGVLAHEVAHVWRRHRGLEVEDRATEEELTDLTTVVLGFGILTTNAAYRYEASGYQEGMYSFTQYSHQSTGYLGPDLLAQLLAVQCLIREVDVRPVRSALGVTQKAVFDEAVRDLAREALLQRMELPDPGHAGWEPLGTPPAVEIKPGRTARALIELAERSASEEGGGQGLLREPLPFEVDLLQTHHCMLASFGRPRADVAWMIELALVEVPERGRVLLVVLLSGTAGGHGIVAGVFDGQIVRRKRELRDALAELFDPPGRPVLGLLEAPSFVRVHSRDVLGSDDLREVMGPAVLRLGPDRLHAELTAFERGGPCRARIVRERKGEPAPAAPAGFNPRKALKRWWDFASDPAVVDDEYSTLLLLMRESQAAE